MSRRFCAYLQPICNIGVDFVNDTDAVAEHTDSLTGLYRALSVLKTMLISKPVSSIEHLQTDLPAKPDIPAAIAPSQSQVTRKMIDKIQGAHNNDNGLGAKDVSEGEKRAERRTHAERKATATGNNLTYVLVWCKVVRRCEAGELVIIAELTECHGGCGGR